jgi:hypothetical protein
MKELWIACLDSLPEGMPETLETHPQFAQVFFDHFVWDWFQKYSEARPLSRASGQLGEKDLRLSSRLDQWGLSPWEPWQVLEKREDVSELQQLGNQRTVLVRSAFAHHRWKTGDALVCRILPHLGHNFTGMSVQVYTGKQGVANLQRTWTDIAKKRGVSPSTRLRPDIHNEIWNRIHRDVLQYALGWEDAPSLASFAPIADALDLEMPLPELGNQSPRDAVKHTFGQHKVQRWLERRAAAGEDVRSLRAALNLPEDGEWL